MKQLIKLEWKRNRLQPYHLTAGLIDLFLLAMPYLFAGIPRLEPFLTYTGITVMAFLSLLCSSPMAGGIGVIALWFGFRKKSVSATIVAVVILAVICCQLLGMAFFLAYLSFVLLLLVLFCAILAGKSLSYQIEILEV